MSGLELAAGQAVNPRTGELLSLPDQTTTDLALWRDEVRDMRDALNEWAKALDGEISSRLDHEGTRSAAVGDWEVKVTPPRVWETDTLPLRRELEDLADAGVLSVEAVNAAIEVVEELKPRRAGLNKLREHANPDVRECVERHDRKVDNPVRRVSVSRRRS